MIIFDIGSFAGFHLMEMYNKYKSSCIIHSFEPYKPIFTQLSTNVENLDNIILNNQACSNIDGSVKFFVNYFPAYNCIKRLNDYSHIDNNVDSITLDTYTLYHPIDCIDLLNLDISCGELECLEGAKILIETKKIKKIHIYLYVHNTLNFDEKVLKLSFLLNGYELSDVRDIAYNFDNTQVRRKLYIYTVA